ncbi:uncharacterized protein LOC123667512 [Melitaea cinxia]|uniref:uncharacterized protein LOC123667512 n=1 Tax=Melitaea cinxia TaxID=113334 RepID=UPI001E2712B6|nr:uncharacterized protein LOC123667512 [Melitaea cinxia]
MKILTSLAVISLAGLVFSAPTNDDNDNEKLIITKSMFNKELVKYTGSHEIVKILLPLNSLNFDEDDSSESNSHSNESDSDDIIIFFVEADIDSDGKYVDQGLYVLKKGKATKILNHGRDAAASSDNSTEVFFGAADGIYTYNKEKNTAEKYGTIDDSIIGIAKESTGDVIYILTENHEVYKVSNKGTKKEKLDDVVNAKQIVLDPSNNLYFYSDDKKPYTRTHEGVKKIEGLPDNLSSQSSVTLIKPPFMIENGVGFVIENNVYIIYANGTSEEAGFEFKSKAKPSAYAPEAALIQYYALNKKIYEFNVLTMLMSEIVDELKEFLNDKSEDIKSISKKSRFSHRQNA